MARLRPKRTERRSFESRIGRAFVFNVPDGAIWDQPFLPKLVHQQVFEARLELLGRHEPFGSPAESTLRVAKSAVPPDVQKVVLRLLVGEVHLAEQNLRILPEDDDSRLPATPA